MKSKLTKVQKGFTIIEVLIVLAIAGLIMLIVFLAVPALQRNSRNTAIKNDVSNVLGGVAEYQAANNGSLPSGISGTGTVQFTGGNTTTASVQGSTVVSSTGAAPVAGTPALGTIVVSRGFKCDGSANTRAVSALFAIETTGGSVRQCQDG